MTTTLPSGDLARVVDLYKQGTSLRLLAAECGVSYGAMRSILIDAGVTLRKRGRPRAAGHHSPTHRPTPAAVAGGVRRPFNVDRAARLYEAGHTLQQIAERTGYSRSRVHVLLRDAGVKMRPGTAPRASRITPAKRRQIIAGWKAGHPHAQIVARARTSTATILKVVAEAGLPPRQRRRYDHAQIKQFYRQGKTLTEIAREVGTTPQYVWNIVNGYYLKSYVPRGGRRRVAATADAT
ncbi:helix-turn-helix domain-containing protein [Streptosporangium sandarakinum]|uniref:Lambda repressor-like predicted transcriptional regulator n=1 Tax=Streptosporangium sandarakinum TaxID=1260955 RepID=A0A852V9B4_9ACTN|nr:helix-turn-helix domain-containing protein [Streptosporangium sandarakinum]NYF44690.1 lambda repressor-like predicted transcriptional regulator [Streptosporangium sandarakinum]